MKFNINSPVFQFINTFCEFILLNIVFLICCLPVFTIGASLSALYQVTIREARGEHGYILKTFFRAFRENFKAATLAFLFYFIAGAVLLFNLVFWNAIGTMAANVILLVLTLLSAMLIISFLYTFPLIARFQNRIAVTIKNSYRIAMEHHLQTIALLLIQGIAILLCIMADQTKLFMVIVGFAFIAYCNSFLFGRVFAGYEKIEGVAD
ncbi:YesL family protein [uncultured Robinsoniella sp.]|uniref:YesL family protein n=1 Tax=uncultured Robinsoniella sp. TaxID=904190 RepID=UPI00374E664E